MVVGNWRDVEYHWRQKLECCVENKACMSITTWRHSIFVESGMMTQMDGESCLRAEYYTSSSTCLLLMIRCPGGAISCSNLLASSCLMAGCCAVGCVAMIILVVSYDVLVAGWCTGSWLLRLHSMVQQQAHTAACTNS